MDLQGRMARAPWGRRLPAMPWLVAATVAVAGCAGPDATDATDAVTAFTQALDEGDGSAACALLLPDAADSLEQDTGEPCAQAVVDPEGPFGETIGAPGAADVADVHVAGRQAQVVTGADTYFLALSGDGWVLTAAVCEARADRPYDCEVEA